MVLVKILGGIDIAGALAFLLLIFNISFAPFSIFCASFLLLKGMFVITGDMLSIVDLVAALILFISVFFTIPVIILWVFTFVMIGKGVISFI